MELSDFEKLKKQRELLVWNLQTKKSETEEEKENIIMDIEKLSPCTLTKSCNELNDVRNAVKSKLGENERMSKKRVLDELKLRRQRDDRVYKTLSPEELELNTLKKAFEFIKKTVFNPQNLCHLVDNHIKTLNMSGIEAFRQLGESLGIDIMYSRSSCQDYRKHLALGLWMEIYGLLEKNEEVVIEQSHCILPIKAVLKLFIIAALKSKLSLGSDVSLVSSVVGAPIVLHIAIMSPFKLMHFRESPIFCTYSNSLTDRLEFNNPLS